MLKTEKIRVACLMNTSYAGSTMMTLLMDSHPQIASVGEGINRRIFVKNPDAFSCSCGEVLIHCAFWKQVAQCVNDQGIDFQIQDLSLGYKYQNSVLRHLLHTYYAHPKLGPWHADLSSRLPIHASRIKKIGRINVAFIRAALKVTGADVFFSASKNLMGHHHLLGVPELEVKFIRIVRDVRSFASSYKLKGKTVPEAIKVWRNYQLCADYLMQTLPEHDVILVRYEDLCRQPDYWLETIHHFLEVEARPLPDVFIPKEHHITGNKIRLQPQLTVQPIERWKTILTDDEIDLTLRLAGPINRRFGYDA